jgi:hypothetical protein
MVDQEGSGGRKEAAPRREPGREARREAMVAIWSRYGTLHLEGDTDQLIAELRGRGERL